MCNNAKSIHQLTIEKSANFAIGLEENNKFGKLIEEKILLIKRIVKNITKIMETNSIFFIGF